MIVKFRRHLNDVSGTGSSDCVMQCTDDAIVGSAPRRPLPHPTRAVQVPLPSLRPAIAAHEQASLRGMRASVGAKPRQECKGIGAVHSTRTAEIGCSDGSRIPVGEPPVLNRRIGGIAGRLAQADLDRVCGEIEEDRQLMIVAFVFLANLSARCGSDPRGPARWRPTGRPRSR
jgi:hypothetical protein